MLSSVLKRLKLERILLNMMINEQYHSDFKNTTLTIVPYLIFGKIFAYLYASFLQQPVSSIGLITGVEGV